MENFDTETKVKITFPLGSPISNDFLNGLTRHADVKLDEHRRIINYKKNGEGPQLSGVHIRSRDMKIEKKMSEFLAEKSENAVSPITDTTFLKEFKLDQETKIKRMFESKAKYGASNRSLKLEGKRIPSDVEWSKEENEQLMRFFVDKAKQTKVPLCLKHLSNEFLEKNGVPRSMDAVRRQIHRSVLAEISKLNDINVETKMRMLYALSIPVDQVFLNELRKKAVVKVDEHQRITKYKANDGSLELEIKRLPPPFTTWSKGKNEKLLNFIAEKSKQTNVPLIITRLCREFAEKNDVSQTMKSVEHYLHKYLLPNISTLNDFDVESRVRMMFALSAPVDQDFLNELRKDAIVEVDEFQKITKYEANNGNLKLETNRSSPTWSKEEKEKLLNFLAEKSKQAKEPLLLKPLCREFAEKNGSSRTMRAVNSYILRHILPNISRLNEFDMETRIRMIFALSAPIGKRVLKELRKEAIVEVDEHQRITKYEPNDGSLQLETERSPPYTVWSKEENDKLLIFIAEKSKQTKTPLNVRSMCRDFAEIHGISRTAQSVDLYIRRSLLPKISKLDNFDLETRIRMMFSLRASVDEEFLKELREKAFVKIDRKRRVTKYKAKDGSLELTRDRRMPAKRKAIRASKEIIRGFSEVSENDEETEDEENEEDVEGVSGSNTKRGRLSKIRFSDNHSFSDSDDDAWESSENVKKSKNKKKEKDTRKRIYTYFPETEGETEDEESGEKEFKANSSLTRSGRISEKQYPGNDFSCDFDDVSFDSAENTDNSKIDKKAEEYVGRTISSSSRLALFKTQKRKFVENHSDVTSSFSKSKKYGTIANTLNNTESEKIASKSDEEIIYDDTVEPFYSVELPIKQELLSYEEMKLENKEYKPDVSFLCSTTQEAIQNYHTENVDQSPREPLSYLKVKLEDEEYTPDLSFLSSTPQDNMLNFSGADGNFADMDQPTDNIEEMTSGREFMKFLHGLVDTLDSPILVELESKIESAIEKLGDEDHNILTEEIVMTLNTGLIILYKNASTRKPPTEESTSLRDFCLILRSTLSTFCNSSLGNFQVIIKETIKKLDNQDKIIPIERIRSVLETVLLLAMP